MNFIRLFPVILSFSLLAAHFLRSGLMPLVVLTLLFPLLLFVKKTWVVRAIQIILVIGALEWIRTLLTLVDLRREAGMPWTRLAIIVGAVAIFTGCSALIFCCSSLKKRYKYSNTTLEESCA
jgi:uncharacterized membrane protein YecN with MAPEG domain